MTRRAYLLPILLGVLAAAPAGAQAQRSGVTTNGSCNIVIVQSQVQAANLNCAGRADIKQLAAKLNAVIRQSKMTSEQVARLVAAVNETLGMKVQLDDVDQREKLLAARVAELSARLDQAPTGAAAVVGNVEQVARDTLARTEQRVGDVRITLRRIESSYGHLAFYFDAVNEGRVDTRMMLFGHGSFGNGGSTIIVGGQRILASGIDFAGGRMPNFVTTTLIPGVPMSGRVDFNGVRAGLDEIAVFELAYSDVNLRPRGYARFRIAP